MKSLLILGRQPALGLAELESLFGAAAVTAVTTPAAAARPAMVQAGAMLDVPAQDIAFERLGGSIKLCRIIETIDTADWGKIESTLLRLLPAQAANIPEDAKVQLGISVYGIKLTTQRLLATGLTLKKSLKRAGRSVRLVPNKDIELNSASVLHNNLTGPNGCELVVFSTGPRIIIATTTAVQDIDSYAARDQGRPMRDSRVGMLPPKLAQIIINLATGNVADKSASIDQKINNTSILDPFCGTGVILQEALLMGYGVYGTDLEPRMVEYSQKNIDWMTERMQQRPAGATEPVEYQITIGQGDATNHVWNPRTTAVACETYLGRPFSALPDPETLNQAISDCNLIIKKFLRNIHNQLPQGGRMCLAVPAWQVGSARFKHLPLLDSLGDMGYNRISFEHVRTEDLLYYRADQVVARQLLVLEKS